MEEGGARFVGRGTGACVSCSGCLCYDYFVGNDCRQVSSNKIS